jgi:PAS domain S-box-containing protein
MKPGIKEHSSARILIVEDEAVVAQDIELRLQSMGYEVVGRAATGEEAVQLALANLPNLILMDIMLRGTMDGIDAALIIRRQVEIPIVYLTAYSDPTTLQRAKVTEPLGYVLKPFTDRELQIAIEIALFKQEAQVRVTASERLLAITLRSINDAVLSTDEHGKVIFVNPVASALTGWPPEEAVGQPFSTVLVLEEEDGTSSALPTDRSAAENGTAARTTPVFLRSRDGKRRLVEYHSSPLVDANGRILGMVVGLHDVTDRRKVEQQIRDTQLRLSTLFEQLPNVVLYETGGGREFVSENITQLLGYPHAKFLDRGFFSTLIHPDDAVEIENHLRKWHAENEPGVLIYQFRVRCADGHYTWLEDHMVEVKSPRMQKYMSGVMIDITDRKRVEEKLRRAKETAEKYDHLKTNFISVISHEIRTPLNAILGCVHLISNALHDAGETELGASLREYFEIIDRSGSRLMKLIESFLDIASIQAGNLKVKLVPLPVDPLVRHAVDELRIRIREAHLDLREEYAAEGAHVSVDAERLAQVLTNILANAVKFTPMGSISVRTFRDGSDVAIAIADTGIGIAPDFLPTVFQPFRQGSEGATRDYQGAGLGLSIAHRLTVAMEGTVSVESTTGSGTTLTVRFPIVASPVVTTSALASTPPIESPLVADRVLPAGRRALVVEDDHENLLYVRTVLRASGWEVESATSGEEAMRLLHLQHHDIVLMDINLGGNMTGFDALKAIRDLGGENIPVIAVTAHAFEEDRMNIMKAGFDDFLAKPFTPDELRGAMQRNSSGEKRA